MVGKATQKATEGGSASRTSKKHKLKKGCEHPWLPALVTYSRPAALRWVDARELSWAPLYSATLRNLTLDTDCATEQDSFVALAQLHRLDTLRQVGNLRGKCCRTFWHVVLSSLSSLTSLGATTMNVDAIPALAHTPLPLRRLSLARNFICVNVDKLGTDVIGGAVMSFYKFTEQMPRMPDLRCLHLATEFTDTEPVTFRGLSVSQAHAFLSRLPGLRVPCRIGTPNPTVPHQPLWTHFVVTYNVRVRNLSGAAFRVNSVSVI
jgi:hypothetical protein